MALDMLLAGLNKLRVQLAALRPDPCCEGGIMHESGGRATAVCSNDCRWQEVELTLATAMVDAELPRVTGFYPWTPPNDMNFRAEIVGAPGYCIFCFEHKKSVAADSTCSYGMHHEFWPEPEVKVKTVKRDAKLCTKCGLHPKNPQAASNGCTHEFES